MKDGGGEGAVNHAHVRGLAHRIEISVQLWITTETSTGTNVVV